MKNQIEKTRSICIAILNYANQKKGVLDEKSKADVKATLDRLDELGTQRHDTREGKTAAQLTLAKATEALKQAILRSRRLLELRAVGNRGAASIPKAAGTSYLASRIGTFALAHRQELESLPADPSVTKSLAGLNAALADFTKAYTAARAGTRDLSTLNHTIDEELSAIAKRLIGYKFLAASSVPRPDRRDLMKLIRSNVPAETHHAKAGDVATDAPQTTATTQPPALPAVPVPVPQTGEHTSIGANA